MKFLWLSALAAGGLASALTGAAPAPHVAIVDAQGVLRWQDTGAELALFGVNYYTPFWHNYPDLKTVGADHRKVMEQDLAHCARLGLDALRLHVFDREISDRSGNLVDNEHLALLDELLARAKERGLAVVLTPIAWWPTPGELPGFSSQFTMPQMITDPAARAAQTNYLGQFLRHVNRVTGLAYQDDPGIVCLELINEPQYGPGTSDAQVVEYINALADAVRATGCRKPIFYNGWCRRMAAVRDARIEGSTFGWYPTGLASGRSLRRNTLPLVDQYGGENEWNPSMRTGLLAGKAKIIYEFDAADVPGSFMYPAMARAFRSGGAQIATQFQYDPLPLAPFNQGWQTHYLNLVCTPQKAISFLIAGEAFRRLPRLQDYGAYPQNTRFGPFRVSYEEDLSELVTEKVFAHSNPTRTAPPAPGKLERIAGCGTSPLVSYEGTGAYFLDKLSPGCWRLEVYPDAVWVNDPYGPHRLDREVARIIWREWPLGLHLPDLGSDFTFTQLNEGNAHQGKAVKGIFPVRPGLYALNAPGAAAGTWPAKVPASQVGLREFYALPGKDSPAIVRHEAATGWVQGRDLPLVFTVALPEDLSDAQVEVHEEKTGESRFTPLKRERAYQYSARIPGDWLPEGAARYRLATANKQAALALPPPSGSHASNGFWLVPVFPATAPVALFSAERHPAQPQSQLKWKKRMVPGMTAGRRALSLAVDSFGPPPNSISFRTETGDDLDCWRDQMAQRGTLLLRARALEPATRTVEIVLLETDGAAWGANLALTTDWREIRCPLASLKYFSHWAGLPATRGQAGDRIRPQNLAGVNVCFGAWLYPGYADEPHTVEIESIEIVP